MSWREFKLGEVACFINGRAYKASELLDEGKYRVLRVGNLFSNNHWYYSNIELGDDKYCDTEDLIYAWSATFGPRIWKGEKVIYHYHIWKVVPDEDKINKYFLYHLLNWDSELIKSTYGAGATMIHVSKSSIESRKALIPPLHIQQRIASILSAYDDLIENNLKRIKLLEEAAHNIYREWFVEMRFPGHETVKMVKDENERSLPERWSCTSFSKVVDINPRTTPVSDVEAPYIPMSSLSETSMVIDPHEFRVPKGGAKFKNGDTLFARITPCLENGKTGFVQCLTADTVATGSTEFIVFRSKDIIGQYSIYLTSRIHLFRENAIKSMSGSDGRQRVNSEAFDNYMINVPEKSLMKQFEAHIEPFFKQIQTLVDMNQRLKEARDILLPRFMNRTIEV